MSFVPKHFQPITCRHCRCQSVKHFSLVIALSESSVPKYPPTPAFAKAGAAPGTTAGVELVLSDYSIKPFQTLQTFTLKHFLWAFKAAVCQTAKAPNPSKIPNNFPNRHPRARPQQWLSMGFQSCRLPARKRSKPSKTLQTLQTPPKPSKPSKHRPQQAPQGQGHFSNRHSRAKATAMAFYGLSKLPSASPQTLQNSPNPPKPSKTRETVQTLQTFTLKQLPQQAPQGQGHSNDFLWAFKAAVCQPAKAPNPSKIPNTFLNRHPRAKATSPTGTPGPGHSNGFLWAFKAAVCQPANAPKLSKPSKPSPKRPNPPNFYP